MSLYSLARSALFALDAENAHEVTLASFAHLPRLATLPFAAHAVRDEVTLLGLRFANRIGLAAGLDKNGECLHAWQRLGFGFVEIGTVTPRPQPGNPRPRMFRLVEQRALINRLGFNNKGVDYLLAQVRRADYRGVLGINIGKNFDTPNERAADDYLYCLRKVYGVASYITLRISSPNTKGLRDLQAEAPLRALLTDVVAEARQLADQHGKRTPVLVKIAPDLTAEQIISIAQIVREAGIDGLIATNTTIARDRVAGAAQAGEAGGLSGAPLREQSLSVLRQLRNALGKDYPLIGVGGIMNAADALERRQAGADLLQIYTGFIYRGPGLIRECAYEMLARS